MLSEQVYCLVSFKKMLKILLPTLIFIFVFLFHLIHFKVVNLSCSQPNWGWLAMYFRLGEYYLGFSYSISLAFAMFAFLRFKEYRLKSIGAGLGASSWAMVLWITGCFLAGCCGSPMGMIYINFFGLSKLELPKLLIALISLMMVLLGYFWLKKKLGDGKS